MMATRTHSWFSFDLRRAERKSPKLSISRQSTIIDVKFVLLNHFQRRAAIAYHLRGYV